MMHLKLVIVVVNKITLKVKDFNFYICLNNFAK